MATFPECLRCATAAVTVVWALVGAHTATPAGRDGAPTSGGNAHGEASDPVSTCAVDAGHAAAPTDMPVGGVTTATVRIVATCTAIEIPLHVVVVLDTDGRDRRTLRDVAAAVDAVGRVVLAPESPGNRMGVAGMGGGRRAHCALTGDLDVVAACVRRVSGKGGTGLPRGVVPTLDRMVDDGMRILDAGRRDGAAGDVHAAMIVFAAPPATRACADLLDTAAGVKHTNVLFLTVCLGRNCRDRCLRQVASSPRYALALDDVDALQAVFVKVANDVIPVRPRRLTLRYAPAGGMRYVTASAIPQPAAEAADGELGWEIVPVPPDGVTVTLRLAATEVGRQPLARQVDGAIVDSAGREVRFVVPAAQVVVGR